MFVLSVGYCSVSLIRDGMKYQIGVDLVLILTLLFLAVGIGIQFVFSGIRNDFLCISIANMLFYIRYYKRYYKNTLQVDAVTCLLNRSFFRELENLQRGDATMPGGSMGFALYDAASSHIQNVIEEADAMLYRNKNG